MTSTPELRYEVVLYWSDSDEAFIAEAPELAGCAADGLTYESALEAVQAVITQWIETARSMGRDVPQPKGRMRFA